MEECGKLFGSKTNQGLRAGSPSPSSRGDLGLFSLQGLRACSACAGDYEDPDRTAWTAEETDGHEREDEGQSREEEFPVQEK